MEASELRIGNIITVDNETHRPLETGYPHIVKEIRKESVVVTLIGVELIEYGQLYKYLKPVPLTEEWLKEFGYESIQELVSHFEELVEEHTGLYLNYYEDDGILFFKSLKVHELQNYWYWNTGKELVKQ